MRLLLAVLFVFMGSVLCSGCDPNCDSDEFFDDWTDGFDDCKECEDYDPPLSDDAEFCYYRGWEAADCVSLDGDLNCS